MDAPQTAPSAADFLASVEILSPFSRDEIERLADYAQARFYSFGETVCTAGDVADGLYRRALGLGAHLHRGARQGNQHGRAQVGRGLRRHRDVARVRHESSVRSSAKDRIAVHSARRDRTGDRRQSGRAGVRRELCRDQFGGRLRRAVVRSARQAEQGGTGRVRAQRRREAGRARARRFSSRTDATTGGSTWCGRAKCASCGTRRATTTRSRRLAKARYSARKPA